MHVEANHGEQIRKAEQQAISAEKAAAQRSYDYWTAQQARRAENAQSENLEETNKKPTFTEKEQVMKGKNSLEMTIEELVKENKEMMSNLTPEQQQWIAEFRKELKPYCDQKTLELKVRAELIHPEFWGPDWDPNNPTPAEEAEMVTM